MNVSPKTIEMIPVLVAAVLVVPMSFWVVYLVDCVQVGHCKPASWILALMWALTTVVLSSTAFLGPMMSDMVMTTGKKSKSK